MPPDPVPLTDAVLAACLDDQKADSCVEGFCDFYVAMTRAKRSLCVIAPVPEGERQEQVTFSFWLARALADQRVFGDPRWFEQEAELPGSAVIPTEPAPPPPVRWCVAGATRRRHPRRTPSGSETHVLSAEQVFAPQSGVARDYGTLVHALLEQIVSPDDSGPLHRWIDDHLPRPEPWQAEAVAEVGKALAVPAIAAALRLPPDASLWREHRFEIILDGTWITGTCDRVHVMPDHAVVLDFKTDRIADEAALVGKTAGYRPQLELYRRVVARLTGLPPERVAARLIFTGTGRVVEV